MEVSPVATLSFLGLVNEAVQLVRKQEGSDAQLYVGIGTPKEPTTNVKDVTNWRFIFTLSDNRTAYIQTISWGEFGPIKVVDEGIVGNRNIPWPFDMDITDAAKLLQQAGYTGPFETVTVRFPLYPGINQPFYIFDMTDGSQVYVGIYDGSVTTNPS